MGDFLSVDALTQSTPPSVQPPPLTDTLIDPTYHPSGVSTVALVEPQGLGRPPLAPALDTYRRPLSYTNLASSVGGQQYESSIPVGESFATTCDGKESTCAEFQQGDDTVWSSGDPGAGSISHPDTLHSALATSSSSYGFHYPTKYEGLHADNGYQGAQEYGEGHAGPSITAGSSSRQIVPQDDNQFFTMKNQRHGYGTTTEGLDRRWIPPFPGDTHPHFARMQAGGRMPPQSNSGGSLGLCTSSDAAHNIDASLVAGMHMQDRSLARAGGYTENGHLPRSTFDFNDRNWESRLPQVERWQIPGTFPYSIQDDISLFAPRSRSINRAVSLYSDGFNVVEQNRLILGREAVRPVDNDPNRWKRLATSQYPGSTGLVNHTGPLPLPSSQYPGSLTLVNNTIPLPSPTSQYPGFKTSVNYTVPLPRQPLPIGSHASSPAQGPQRNRRQQYELMSSTHSINPSDPPTPQYLGNDTTYGWPGEGGPDNWVIPSAQLGDEHESPMRIAPPELQTQIDSQAVFPGTEESYPPPVSNARRGTQASSRGTDSWDGYTPENLDNESKGSPEDDEPVRRIPGVASEEEIERRIQSVEFNGKKRWTCRDHPNCNRGGKLASIPKSRCNAHAHVHKDHLGQEKVWQCNSCDSQFLRIHDARAHHKERHSQSFADSTVEKRKARRVSKRPRINRPRPPPEE